MLAYNTDFEIQVPGEVFKQLVSLKIPLEIRHILFFQRGDQLTHYAKLPSPDRCKPVKEPCDVMLVFSNQKGQPMKSEW